MKGTFGPVIVIAALVLVIMIAISFSNVIFANSDAATNTTNMTNETRQAYNTTTDLVQTGSTVFGVTGWLMIGGVLIFAGIIFYKMAT
jgi:poly-D-alanine transfer protein DltD